MAPSDTGRTAVRSAREHLEEWTFAARDRAFEEFFEGSDPVLSDEELALLDRIDSDLTRRGESGLWGADEYGIVAGNALEAGEPSVVCTYHPEIPYEGYRGEESLDEATREELNDKLWDYCERVADHVEDEFEEFREESGAEG